MLRVRVTVHVVQNRRVSSEMRAYYTIPWTRHVIGDNCVCCAWYAKQFSYLAFTLIQYKYDLDCSEMLVGAAGSRPVSACAHHMSHVNCPHQMIAASHATSSCLSVSLSRVLSLVGLMLGGPQCYSTNLYSKNHCLTINCLLLLPLLHATLFNKTANPNNFIKIFC